MSLDAILKSMRSRMPWPVAQKVLETNDIPRGRGWDLTESKLADNENEEFEAALIEAVQSHTMCGEKLTRFYHLSRAERERLRRLLLEVAIEDSEFNDVFPLVLSDDEMEDIGFSVKLVERVEFQDGLAVFFGSTRVVTVREQLSADEFPEDAADALERYDEIIGIKHRKIHSVDVIWIPNDDNYVDVRVDYPTGINRRIGEVAHTKVAEAVAGLVGYDALVNPANLFPLIEEMYQASTDGKVVELSFGTTTSSLKNEKMRRKRLCLRTEQYHVGGSNALATPIEPHKLSIVWPLSFGPTRYSFPELGLHSTSFERSKANPQLFDAIISNCMGHSDYDHVRSRILDYLP